MKEILFLIICLVSNVIAECDMFPAPDDIFTAVCALLTNQIPIFALGSTIGGNLSCFRQIPIQTYGNVRMPMLGLAGMHTAFDAMQHLLTTFQISKDCKSGHYYRYGGSLLDRHFESKTLYAKIRRYTHSKKVGRFAYMLTRVFVLSLAPTLNISLGVYLLYMNACKTTVYQCIILACTQLFANFMEEKLVIPWITTRYIDEHDISKTIDTEYVEISVNTTGNVTYQFNSDKKDGIIAFDIFVGDIVNTSTVYYIFILIFGVLNWYCWITAYAEAGKTSGLTTWIMGQMMIVFICHITYMLTSDIGDSTERLRTLEEHVYNLRSWLEIAGVTDVWRTYINKATDGYAKLELGGHANIITQKYIAPHDTNPGLVSSLDDVYNYFEGIVPAIGLLRLEGRLWDRSWYHNKCASWAIGWITEAIQAACDSKAEINTSDEWHLAFSDYSIGHIVIAAIKCLSDDRLNILKEECSRIMKLNPWIVIVCELLPGTKGEKNLLETLDFTDEESLVNLLKAGFDINETTIEELVLSSFIILGRHNYSGYGVINGVMRYAHLISVKQDIIEIQSNDRTLYLHRNKPIKAPTPPYIVSDGTVRPDSKDVRSMRYKLRGRNLLASS